MNDRRRFSAWPLALVAVALMALLGWWLFLRAIPKAPSMDDAGRVAEAIARAFRQGTLSTEFTSYATELEGTQRLQVASLEVMERISQRDQASVLWGQLQLPEVVVQASLPVTYSYYVDLERPWQLDWDDSSRKLTVRAPSLEWTPPAVDISGMRIEAAQPHPLRDEAAAIERLRTAVTPWLEERAATHRALVEAAAREEVEDWVRSWVQADYGQVGEIEVIMGGASDGASRVLLRPEG